MALALTTAIASPALADTAPVAPATVPTVSADALPTAQINGVAWDQVVVGNTVYVTGEFTSARPAGAPAGTNEVPRTNLLAYDITTGVLNPTWAPTLNAKGATIAASTDGTRIFVGGSFTSVSGTTRYRVVALDAITGAVIPTWSVTVNARVRTLVVSGSTLYMGGIFTSVGGQPRTRLAAVTTATGALTAWAPTADAEVMALTAPAGSGKIVAGGKFANLNGTSNYGMGALDATTGAVLPWAIKATVRNAGENSAIYSLSTDGNQVYGTGYTYGSGGNFEGTFAARASDGGIVYVSGCRGDTYDSVPIGDVLYSVGHSHDCSSIGGLPQQNPWTFQRGQAQTIVRAPSGLLTRGGNFNGQPAPELLHWLPDLENGAITGSDQAAWTAEGNSDYVALAGEFPRVNNTPQAGLVRFATRAIAPNNQGPQGGGDLEPVLTEAGPGAVRITYTSAWDRDNRQLTYQLLRGATTAGSVVVATQTRDTTWWSRPIVKFVDGSAPGGSSQSYRIRVSDALGNTVTSAATTITVPAGGGASPYAAAVRSDGASSYWRLGEASGTVGYDWNGSDDLNLATTVTRSAPGALSGDANTATRFAGTGTLPGVSSISQVAPATFTSEAWFKSTSTTGGKILGFGNSKAGNSSSFDRHIYMTNNGRLVFGVSSGGARAVTTTASYNNGEWHHVAGTLGASGMRFYVDGVLVGSNEAITTATSYNGYWRVGGDSIGSTWPNTPFTTALNGTIDDVAIYPTVLSPEKILLHSQLGTATVPNQAPTASFTSSVTDLAASFNASASTDSDGTIASYAWDFGDGATGTGTTASHTYTEPGTYTVELTVTDDDGATGTTTSSVTVVEPVNNPPTASFISSVTGLVTSFNGSASSDSDGTIASYAWNFGDGTTGTGSSPTHTYADSGTYTVQLTVTDNGGETGTVSHAVTVTAPGTGDTVAADAFGRTVASGWGASDTGGTWTSSASGITLSVGGGTGQASIPAGRTLTTMLNSVSNADTDLTHEVSMEGAATGGGVQFTSVVRSTGAGSYRATVKVSSSGQVAGSISSMVGTTASTLAASTVASGVTFTPGATLMVRAQAFGTSPTTIRYKVWLKGSSEPSNWLQSVTDSTAGLQQAGALGLITYVSGSATAPAVVKFDNLAAIRL